MEENTRTKEAKRITWIGFFINLILTAGKLVAGFLGNSAAMVADGIHSLSDFATDIVVIAFVGISGKEKDQKHPYGHGKYETFATLIIAVALLIVGIGILVEGIEKILSVINGETLQQPGIIALIAAISSIIAKELLFRYTIKVGKKIDSQAVIANGWHHRSDAFSSIGTAIGIGGAILLGNRWTILDPLAGVIVSIFIIKVSIELALPSVRELLEVSLPTDTEAKIAAIILEDSNIITYHRLRTRQIGSVIAIDVHIKLDKEISFIKSHDIASALEKRLRAAFGNQTEINLHTEPYLDR